MKLDLSPIEDVVYGMIAAIPVIVAIGWCLRAAVDALFDGFSKRR